MTRAHPGAAAEVGHACNYLISRLKFHRLEDRIDRKPDLIRSRHPAAHGNEQTLSAATQISGPSKQRINQHRD